MNIFKLIAGLYLPSRYKVTNQPVHAWKDRIGVIRGPQFEQFFVWKEDAVKEFNDWVTMKNYDTAVYQKQGGIWLKIMEWDEITQKLHIYEDGSQGGN